MAAAAQIEDEPTLEAEKGEECNVLGTLLTLGQLCKDQESPPSLATAETNALQPHCQIVEKALSHTAPSHDALSTNMLVCKVDEGEDDADGEDPFRDIERDWRLNFGRPLVEDQQIDGCECVDAVNCYRQQEREVKVAVGSVCEEVARLEVVELL